MKDMIKLATDFQYSVNLHFDIQNTEKIKNYIPTSGALEFIEDILLSTNDNATERSRVLIGPYGKGKSHMVLTVLGLLMKRDLKIFKHLVPKFEEHLQLKKLVDEYYGSEKKLLPVIISGSSSSIEQAFLMALERALRDEDLHEVMPETNYQAAIRCIERWEKDFPDTYNHFVKILSEAPQVFIERLKSFDITAYEEFQQLYPSLTAGSIFNPFLGFDVVELYEGVIQSIQSKGYTGIFVVYDEFSKFLEANIKVATVSDTKLLQDFAEKCNRSGSKQMHLLLISHKEIANYIDNLPKQKTDGWRGVSERFKHVHFNDEYVQTYDIISTVISKDKTKWNSFRKKYAEELDTLVNNYKIHAMFNDVPQEARIDTLLGAYPLHPSSLFVLPRLSERVAQNERTLFTFLSADSHNTMSEFIKEHGQETFSLITPDYIFDYFQPLMEKEVHTGTIYKNYELAKNILVKLEDNSLEGKIIKILAVIYMLEQYDILCPVREELEKILEPYYSHKEVTKAVDELIDKEYVIYLKRSNGFLCLKQSSGVNIYAKIADMKAAKANTDIKEILNTLNFDRYVYPARYNDEKEMTRFFVVEFIYASEITDAVNWEIKGENIKADGVIYAVLVDSEDELESVKTIVASTTATADRCIFALPNNSMEIRDKIIELYAVNGLREEAVGDSVLYSEYDLVYEDLYAILKDFLQGYTRPEKKQVSFYYLGAQQGIYRKAMLSELMSKICDRIFDRTPIINNEVINKDEITTTAQNSRQKVLSAILRKEVEPELGLSGFGQEVSIMRSTLVKTGLLTHDGNVWTLGRHSSSDEKINIVMDTICSFIDEAGMGSTKSFGQLYEALMSPAGGIGLRRGVIPIYIAVALHLYKGRIIIYDGNISVDVSADILQQINVKPEHFSLERLDWSEEKEEYIQALNELFNQFDAGRNDTGELYEQVARGMYTWYLSLPKYAKELTVSVSGDVINKEYVKFIRCLKTMQSANNLLFQKIPQVFATGIEEPKTLIKKVSEAKALFDGAVPTLMEKVTDFLREKFSTGQPERASLQSIMQDWCESLPDGASEELFEDGTDKFLDLCQQTNNNENEWLSQVGKMAMGLRFIDWDQNTYKLFCQKIIQYKETAENHVGVKAEASESGDKITSGFEFTFVNHHGKIQRRRFGVVNYSPRAKLLLNSIKGDIDAMGHSISEQEKRQVLAEILQNLC